MFEYLSTYISLIRCYHHLTSTIPNISVFIRLLLLFIFFFLSLILFLVSAPLFLHPPPTNLYLFSLLSFVISCNFPYFLIFNVLRYQPHIERFGYLNLIVNTHQVRISKKIKLVLHLMSIQMVCESWCLHKREKGSLIKRRPRNSFSNRFVGEWNRLYNQVAIGESIESFKRWNE